MCTQACQTLHVYMCKYMVTCSAAPPPPPKWSGKPPPRSVVWVVVGLIGNPPPCLWWGLVSGNPPPSFFPHVVWGLVGGGFPPPVVWGRVGIPLPPSLLWCGVWWGHVHAGRSWWGQAHGPSRMGSPSGREASLVRQTMFCRRRFCSETLGCPFKCFGRPWRFLLGTIQNRAVKSVLVNSRPPIIDYTLCHILYTIYSRVYPIYYRLQSV